MNKTTSFLLLALLHPTTVLSIDSAEDVQIQADYMKLDLETGSSAYTGNVSIIQGTITLTGERVVITRENNEIQNINVDGNPARYLQDEDTDNKVHALSQKMQYITRAHRLIMTQNATLEQSNQTVESQRIVYDTQNKVIIAGKTIAPENPSSDGNRVNIILTPKKETQPAGNQGEQQ